MKTKITPYRSIALSILLAAGLLAGLLMFVSRMWAAPGVPPVALHPPRNAITATLDTIVSVTYDEPIDPSTVTSRTFAVYGMQSGLVTATHTVVDGNTIVVTPPSPFHQGELVYAIATTRTLNITGTGPISATQWQFNADRVISRCVAGLVTDTVASANLLDVYASSVAWGDYDNDGDLDVLLAGDDDAGHRQALVYENQSGVFVTDTVASQNLTGVAYGSVAWGDYDGDGDLDILLTGLDDGSGFNALIYENQSGVFVLDTGASQNLTNVYYSSGAWGDYDNDGDLDILLTGTRGGFNGVAEVYENTGSSFVADAAASANLPGMFAGSGTWGDYDDDGDLDILLTGNDGSRFYAAVYENRTGTFVTDTVASANLTPAGSGNGTWGDYDNDGDLDILLTGDSASGHHAQIYENQSGVFVTDLAASQNLAAVYLSSVDWGDYDNDGDLDILLTGYDGADYHAHVYENEAGVFITDTLASANLTGVYRSSVAWGDYDTDGDLDILLTGWDDSLIPQALIYRNDDCPIDLALAKTADPEPVVAGTGLTYTLVITNQGTDPATSVTLSDTLHPSTTLQTLDQTDDTPQEFVRGTFDDTHLIDPRPDPGFTGDERVSLVDGAFAGTFTSRVFDAANVVSWTSLSWVPDRPYWKPLPDNGGEEWGYAYGEANMTGNRILLHMDSLADDTITDTSGLNNHGRCPATAGEACPSYTPGYYFNGGLSFSGSQSETVVITDTLDPLRYAAELWVWVPGGSEDDTTSFILRTDTPTGTAATYSHLLGMVDGHFQHTVYDGGYRTITSTTPVTPGVWHHVAGTAESDGDMKLYVDGRLEATLDGIGTLWDGGGWYRLGSSYGPAGTTAYFTGSLDEVAVYSRTLSSGEVLDHYLRGALRLFFQVRSCDDPACAGESFGAPFYSEWSNDSLTRPANVPLSGVPDNRYFQYRVFFESNHPDYSPRLRRVTVGPAHRAVFASQGSCAAGAHAFNCNLGDLAGGDVISVTAYADVHPSALGVITNTAAVSATTDLTSTNNLAVVTSTVNSEVDIDIAKHDDDDLNGDGYPEWHYGAADPVNPGSPMTYTLQIHNGGPSTAWDVWVSDTLPITPTTISHPAGWDCSGSSGAVLSCTAPALLPHSWPHIVIRGDAPETIGVITNTAWLTAQASSVYPTSRLSDTETTSVEPLADLSVVKTATPAPVNPGDDVTFVITVTNDGPAPADGVEVIDTVLSGQAAHIVSSGSWTCGALGSVVTCTLPGGLAVGGTEPFVISATAPLTGFVGNRAQVGATTYDPQEENDVDYAFARVLPVADLHVIKADVVDPVPAGGWLTYTFHVSNTGPAPAGAITATLDYANDQLIAIPPSGRARAYPSSLYVGGLAGVITDLQVQLHGLEHTYPADLSLLLIGPGGRSVVLMSNAGGGVDVAGVTLTFDDAGIPVPISGTLTSTVTYRPSNYGLAREFYPPAPESPYGGSLSAFTGASPNGLWRLYAMDTVGGDPGGQIGGGWSLHFGTTTRDAITLTDDLPTGVGFVASLVPPGWTCGDQNEAFDCTGDHLGVNEPAVITLTVTAPITDAVITNTVAVTATTADFWPRFNQDTITTTVLPTWADLEVVKTVEPPVVKPNGILTYTVAITNHGPLDATAVTLTDVITGMADLSVHDVTSGWSCVEADPVITCTHPGPFTSGAEATLWLTGTAPSGSPLPLSHIVVTNTARVRSGMDDLQPADNTSAITVAVTMPPTAIASVAHDVVFVDEHVLLVGASYDPDNNWPLTYFWVQSGGPPVSLHGAGSRTPSFTAPGTPTVLSFTLWVTDSLGMICDQPDTVTITVTDRTVAGLTAANDSPTEVGQPVNFTAAITQGTNVSYTWDFGNGITGVGRTPDQTYTTAGPYTAVVTASNSASVLTATTMVSVTAPVTRSTYLPLVFNHYVPAPDLVVEEIVATPDQIQVVIRNVGDASVEDEFWVDGYIDPNPAPTAVNQTWPDLTDQGLVWGVEADLAPGEALTLTVDGPFYWATLSNVTWPLAVGTPVYAQVDSAHAETGYGAVLEVHEIHNWPYENNILHTVVAASAVIPETSRPFRLVGPAHVPPRR
jgi:uncharacterized repeat protein (TIGR01451 family)